MTRTDNVRVPVVNIDISKEKPGAVGPDAEESDATALAGDAGSAGDSEPAAEATSMTDTGVTDAESAAPAEPTAPPGDPAHSPSPRRAPLAVTAVAAVALIVAVVTAGFFGVGWARAALFTDGPRAAARDSALDAARQAAINMTSMKLDDVPGSLALARSSMTGAILTSAEQNQQKSEQLATEAGVGMQSKVLGASLTTLNSENDRATALVVLQVSESRADRSVSDYRYTWSLEMAEVDGVWKAEQVASLAQPVLLSGPGPNGLGQPAAQPSEAAQPPADTAPAPRPGS